MYGGVATGCPASTHLEQGGVINLADKNLAPCDTRSLHLGMASKAQVGVALEQELAIDGTVRVVANSATLAHRLMIKDKRLRLFAVALCARFI